VWRVRPRESTSPRRKRGEWWPNAKATELGGVWAITEPRDEDQVSEGKGVPDQIEVRGKEDRNEIRTFRRCRPYRKVIQGGRAIPGSRATGATTSTIPRDCDQPIDERKGLPTVPMLSEAAKQVQRKEGKVTVKPYNQSAKATGRSEGNQRGEGWW